MPFDHILHEFCPFLNLKVPFVATKNAVNGKYYMTGKIVLLKETRAN